MRKWQELEEDIKALKQMVVDAKCNENVDYADELLSELYDLEEEQQEITC